MSHISRQHEIAATGFRPVAAVLSLRGMQLAALVLVVITLLITSGGAG